MTTGSSSWGSGSWTMSDQSQRQLGLVLGRQLERLRLEDVRSGGLVGQRLENGGGSWAAARATARSWRGSSGLRLRNGGCSGSRLETAAPARAWAAAPAGVVAGPGCKNRPSACPSS